MVLTMSVICFSLLVPIMVEAVGLEPTYRLRGGLSFLTPHQLRPRGAFQGAMLQADPSAAVPPSRVRPVRQRRTHYTTEYKSMSISINSCVSTTICPPNHPYMYPIQFCLVHPNTVPTLSQRPHQAEYGANFLASVSKECLPSLYLTRPTTCLTSTHSPIQPVALAFGCGCVWR
jgi:hypothetical protein